MSDQIQTQGAPWHDPIVQELHDIREQLVEKYHGNMTAYSQAAKAHALALGFRFEPMRPESTELRADCADPAAFSEILDKVPHRTPLVGDE